MKRFATKFAASTMVIALAMVGCQADMLTSAATASTAERSAGQANRFAENARTAAQRGDLTEALRLAERAVELAPRDAGYRMLLADVYMKNGRFRSAETSYADVIEIDQGNIRAGLSIALTQIAQGRSGDALVSLEEVQDRAPAVDVGLAYALAGQPQRAIELLEPAARSAGADGRTRQNLALAYALAGDWARARTVAAQDVSPADLNSRLQSWAAMARPSGQATAVAGLLGVTPVEDAGQPVRLALNGEAPVAYAAAAPAPLPAPVADATDAFAQAEAPAPVAVAAVEAPAAQAEPVAVEVIRYAEAPVVVAPAPAPVAEAAPVRFAAAAPAPAPVAEQPANWWPAPTTAPASAPAPAQFAAAEPVDVAEPVQVAAAVADEAPAPAAVAAVLSAPSPVLTRTVAPALTARPIYRQAPVNRAAAVSARLPRSAVASAAANGNFVVQLGAFADAANAERAWNAAQSRYGVSRGQMRTASVSMGGRQLTRVSVAGFANRAEAVRLCSSIQSQGGSCFVRGTAGDAPNVRWASRAGTARRG
ncbi:MAG TPA: SPOR domain-containing protein [Allosphingosinicella sp.]|jgi:Flp pilus assembly protein TadD